MTDLIRKDVAARVCRMIAESLPVEHHEGALACERAIAALPVVTVGSDLAGWVRRLRKTEEAGQAHHVSKADRLAIADFLAALTPTPVDASQAADPAVNAPAPAAIREAALLEAAWSFDDDMTPQQARETILALAKGAAE